MKRKRSERVILTEFDIASCIDFLHGDVADDEFEAACDYEYARESQVLREAARLYKRGLSFVEIGEEIDQAFSCGSLFLQSPWFEFFTGAHFPETPWNSLSAEDRREILSTLPLPFGKGALRSVEAQRALALQTRLGFSSGQHDLVVFLLDWAKGKKRLLREFAAWLDRPENRRILAKFSNRRTGKTGGPVDRLKDLAAWRLFEHCGNDWNKANDFASEHRKVFEKPQARVIGSGRNSKRVIFKKGDPKPFHDPRQGQQERHQLNEALLYSEESGFLKARSRALAFLKERMPWEFFKEARAAELEELQAQAQRAYEQLPEGYGAREFAEMMRGLLQERENDPDPLVKLKERRVQAGKSSA